MNIITASSLLIVYIILILVFLGLGITLSVLGIKCMKKYLNEDKK